MPEWIVKQKRYQWFPDIIVVRRVPGSEEVIGGGAEDQWQGFVKQMKMHFAKETGLINNKFKIQKDAMDKMQADITKVKT